MFSIAVNPKQRDATRRTFVEHDGGPVTGPLPGNRWV
jgi:hypothetical protein